MSVPHVAAAPLLGRLLGLVRHRIVFDVVLGATFMVALHLFVVQISIVKGHSMEPSLHDGDRLVVDRVTCNFGEVHRGDVVVLRYPRNPTVDFVKRVVGLPGDLVSLRNGQLWVNGAMAPDDWTCIADRETTHDVAVPDGCYFVLGRQPADQLRLARVRARAAGPAARPRARALLAARSLRDVLIAAGTAALRRARPPVSGTP
jgi:signal peptidase I